MSILGLTRAERPRLNGIDFSRHVVLDFWLYLTERPDTFHHLFSIKQDEFRNSLSVGPKGRRLKVYHGNGEHRVILFDRELRERTLPLHTWVRISVRREVEPSSLVLDLRIGRFRRRVRRRQVEGTLSPYSFPLGQRPEPKLFSDGRHVGLIAGFRFEGAEQRYLAHEGGRLQSNVELPASRQTPAALSYQNEQVLRGTENAGVYVHALQGRGAGTFKVVEKKTHKSLEAAVVGFVHEKQREDRAIG